VGKFGVVPQQLEDAALERELCYLYGTRAETFFHRSWQALLVHTERILQLGQEDASRFPIGRDRQPATRKGSRARAGQPLGRSPRPGPSR
jgi:hypothetical protein